MSRSENDQHRPAASERAGTDCPRIVVGLGPHGERPASVDTISLSAETLATARESDFKVSIILHTTQSDWSKRQIDGIKSALSEARAEILEIIDCSYDPQAQVEALNRLAKSKADAVIGIPIGSRVVADAFRQISAANIALVKGGVLKGVAAQRPYEQGRTAALVALLALTGNSVPPWIALPGIAVTADNVAEAYQHVGGAPASLELMAEKSSD